MGKYYAADIVGGAVIIRNKKIDKKTAMTRIKQGKNVYTNKSMAKTLSEALNDGKCNWKDGAHGDGMYKHYHDGAHVYAGHIFYGGPSV